MYKKLKEHLALMEAKRKILKDQFENNKKFQLLMKTNKSILEVSRRDNK